MTPRKEPKKCREWEKLRRDKLNSAFSVLSKLLPNHDPSLTCSKVDILQKASQYIEELQSKLKSVLTTEGTDNTKRCEIKMLCSRVKKLLLRNEQLCNLLKDAGITIPSEFGSVKHFKEPLRWSNKFTQEQAKKLQNEEMQKENKKVGQTVKKRNLKKSTVVACKHQRKANKKMKLANKKTSVISLHLSNVIPLANHQPLSKVSNQPCFIITNKPSPNLPLGLQQNGKTKASTVVTNSNSLTTPKMASIVKPPQKATGIPKVSAQTLNSLGPGTLILANGNIVPILPSSAVIPPTTILTNPPPIILKPPPTNTTLIVMPPSTSTNKTTKPVTTTTNNVSMHPRIRPKRNITRTTQSNKVPIPAIPRFRDTTTITTTEKVNQKKKEEDNNINTKNKRKDVTNETPNKKIKSTTLLSTQSVENENKKNAEQSTGEHENIEKETSVDKENVDVPVSDVPVSVIETISDKIVETNISQSQTVTESLPSVPTTTTTSEVQVSLPNVVPKKEEEVPVTTQEEDKIHISPPTTTTSELTVNLNHSELSNDLFSTLQVPIGGQNPESTSPTAAFLLAFPLVSSLTGVKVTEVIEEENSDSRHGTPTLLQIGTMETTKTTQSVHAESLTPNLLNLDNFSFFSSNNFYPSFDSTAVIDSVKTSSACAKISEVPTSTKIVQPVTSSSHITSTNPPLYSTEPTIVSKATVSMVSNSFAQQNPVVSYSKPHLPPPLVTTTYLQNTVATNNCPGSTSKPADMQYNSVSSMAQCNAFNPFSDFSKPNSYPSFTKSYSDPLYTNSNYSYSHHNDSNFNQNVYYPPKSSKPNNSYNTTNYSDTTYNFSDSRKRHMPYYNQNKTQSKPNTKSSKINNHPKPPINWMTTPDFRSQPSSGDYLVPPIDYNPNTFYTSNSTHTTYFNTTSSMYPSSDFQNSIGDNRKTFDSSLPILPTNSSQRNEFEENQFSWSPTKLPQFLETPHTFVSSTLPTLVGDLALGTAQTQFNEQKIDQSKTKESTRRSKVHSVTYDNQSNFLSVSQLVENKSDPGSSRTTNRRNSGNRNVKGNSQKKSSKPVENKEMLDVGTLTMDKKQNLNYGMPNVENQWMNDCNKPIRHTQKNAQSSYSAEALIGHQDHTETSVPKQRYRQQPSYPTSNKALPIPTFLSDNIVPYFPPVEIAQDNNFMQANTNYQSFNTSVQNNSYVSSGPTITSSYLQPSGLIPEFQNYPPMIPDEKLDSKHCSRNSSVKQASGNNRTEERLHINQVNTDCDSAANNFPKKSKNKQVNESNLPGIVDFGFLSIPNTINSPILPDDFHTHSNFLPPPTPSQLYPCKNSLYGKQSSELLPLPPVPVSRSSTQNFDAPPSVPGNAGSSLTSFNLSAIFPEINKGSMPLPGICPDPSKNKNYNFQRNYIGSSVQVFKSTSSTSYVNSLATAYAPSN